MSVYVRGDSFWYEFQVRGVRYRGSIGKVTRKIAREVADKKRIEALEGKLVERPTKAPLFGHYDAEKDQFSKDSAAAAYWRFYVANRKPSSATRMHAILAGLCAVFGNQRLTEICPRKVEQYKLDRKAAGKKDATVNRELAALKGLMTMGIRWGWLRQNPVSRVRFFCENNARQRFLTLDEERELLKKCHELGSLRLAALVIAAVDTGFRASELGAVRWADVDFERGEIAVASCYTKNGEPRRNPMTRRLQDMLTLLRGTGKADAQAAVFGPYRYHKAFWKARDAAGLGKDVCFHTLRHTFISRLVMAGVDIRTVQELAGHKEIKMTMRYAHLAPEQKRRAVGYLEDLLDDKPKDKKPDGEQADDQPQEAPKAETANQVPTISPTAVLAAVASACGARSSAVRAGDS